MRIIQQALSTCPAQQAVRLFPRLMVKSPSARAALKSRAFFINVDPRATRPLRIVSSQVSGFHSSAIRLHEKQASEGRDKEGIHAKDEADAPAKSVMDQDDHIQHQHQPPMPPNTDPKARMLIGFTCTVCENRSHKTMSKHAYNHGVVIIQCDHCKNRHLIADHLGWFRNGGVTVEDLVKEKGETVQKLTAPYQKIKDGGYSKDASSGIASDAGSTQADVNKTPEQIEFEKALEKAAEGMLEWIPQDVLELEKQRMEKSRSNAKTEESNKGSQ
ncbi:Threonine synthase-like 1 [Actinomortierella ambigua]|nr:Threonine synthase-like 1 [Actinomortierella ambigua]